MNGLKKSAFILFLGISFLFSGCEEKNQQGGNTSLFQVEKHGISFIVPSAFTLVSGANPWGEFKWRDADAALSLSLKVHWNSDLKYYPLRMALDIFISSHRAEQLSSNLFLEEEPVQFLLTTEIDALSFKASENGLYTRGIYLIANSREYILELKSPLEQKESRSALEAWDTIKKTFRVEVLSDHKEYVRKLLKEQEQKGSQSIREILDYGQQIMSGRESYIRNYPRAIKEFRKALGIMENLNPKPSEYNRALRLLTIAKELQRKAYEKHQALYNQSERLMQWVDASSEAGILLQLMEDDLENPMAQWAKNKLSLLNEIIQPQQ
jgi:hypothetical protein